MLRAFQHFIKKHQLIAPRETVLLAVSGGVDSVVMAHLFQEAGLSFAIAHCNFGLRPDADQDAALVKECAEHYQVAFYEKTFATQAYAQTEGVSIQMAARALRYRWFQTLCDQHQLDKIATAHHANDQLETLLFNLTKGTGIAGLRGMLPQQGNIIRPLLFASKAALVQYAQTAQLSWREDLSNQKNDYHRNLIRNKVVPLLQNINPAVVATTQRTMEKLAATEALLQDKVVAIKQAYTQQKGTVYHINVASFLHQPWAAIVLAELLKPFGFNFTSIQKLCEQTGKCGQKLLSETHQLIVDRACWLVAPDLLTVNQRITISSDTPEVIVPEGTLTCSIKAQSTYTIPKDPAVAAFDLDLLQFPLTIRRWQRGDFFYPLGMQHRKKLSDFFIDQKVSLLDKQRSYVLTSGAAIVWVIGHRIDDRYKITPATKRVYEAVWSETPEKRLYHHVLTG